MFTLNRLASLPRVVNLSALNPKRPKHQSRLIPIRRLAQSQSQPCSQKHLNDQNAPAQRHPESGKMNLRKFSKPSCHRKSDLSPILGKSNLTLFEPLTYQMNLCTIYKVLFSSSIKKIQKFIDFKKP